MKLLQIVVLATVLVASVHAIKCNVGTATGTCPSTDLGSLADTCYKCVSGGVAVSGGCMKGASCDTLKTACKSPAVYSDCTTDNCNGCSPASTLQVSIGLFIAALAAMLF